MGGRGTPPPGNGGLAAGAQGSAHWLAEQSSQRHPLLPNLLASTSGISIFIGPIRTIGIRKDSSLRQKTTEGPIVMLPPLGFAMVV